jgi:hypothetical protein
MRRKVLFKFSSYFLDLLGDITRLDADHLITDKPALGRSGLEERARLGVPERLLMGVAELLGLPTRFTAQ